MLFIRKNLSTEIKQKKVNKVKFLLFTKLMYYAPVIIINRKPLTITRPNIDINGCKTIIFLVAYLRK